jgi:hypothetical protein
LVDENRILRDAIEQNHATIAELKKTNTHLASLNKRHEDKIMELEKEKKEMAFKVLELEAMVTKSVINKGA